MHVWASDWEIASCTMHKNLSPHVKVVTVSSVCALQIAPGGRVELVLDVVAVDVVVEVAVLVDAVVVVALLVIVVVAVNEVRVFVVAVVVTEVAVDEVTVLVVAVEEVPVEEVRVASSTSWTDAAVFEI